MNYALQIATSGLLTAMYRQDVFSNNLANMDTPGFKADVPATRFRAAARQEDGLNFLPSNQLLEKLGAGVHLMPNRVDFEQGSLEITGRPLDVAVEGEGFFVLRESSSGSQDRIRLTRDGRFARNAQGLLVSASNGMPVMGVDNRPIAVPDDAKLSISSDGVVRSGNAAVGQLSLISVADTARLEKEGNSLFAPTADQLASRTRGTGLIRQGAIERSSADEVQSLMRLQSASREVDQHVAIVQAADRMMDRAINGLGRIS
ncbi:MAG: flagellar hook basal-body protein [Planctomycetota bacterium]|nr:flagellar hook basal-body protein [Planctomycetota bacterium]